jgi:type I restriction enzyme S subunit
MIPVPPQDEQQQISRYLDWQTSKINQFIKAKKKLIALLKEQKQNIINEAVTKGINQDVEMKDSGVAWLGNVPEHWNVLPIKRFVVLQNGITLGANYYGQEAIEKPYLRVANVQNGHFDLRVVKTISIPVSDVFRYLLRAGDVLITEGGDLDKLGRGEVWEDQVEGCLHQNHIFCVRTNEDIMLPKYLSIILNARPGREYFMLTAKKTTNLASTNSSKVKAFHTTVPPLEEQEAIVRHIEKETALIDKTIARTEREIELIQEYRIRLVSDAVTGKIDVRSVEIPDFEPEEADLETQDEEESEDELIADGIEE